jgi:hypothetical protein
MLLTVGWRFSGYDGAVTMDMRTQDYWVQVSNLNIFFSFFTSLSLSLLSTFSLSQELPKHSSNSSGQTTIPLRFRQPDHHTTRVLAPKPPRQPSDDLNTTAPESQISPKKKKITFLTLIYPF